MNADIAADLPVVYADESHISVGDYFHECSGPRTHVTSTGNIIGFRLFKEIVYDRQLDRYLLIGFVGENSDESMRNLKERLIQEQMRQMQSDNMFLF